MIYRNQQLRCRQVRRLLSTYLEGRLDTATTQHFHHHTAQCGACRLTLNSALTTLLVYFSTDCFTAPRSIRQAA